MEGDSQSTVIYISLANLTSTIGPNFTCPKIVPSSGVYLRNLDTLYTVLLVFAFILTFIVVLIYIVEFYMIFKYVSSLTQRQRKLVWLTAIFPYTSILCVVGLCIPRAIAITEAFILLFFARCLFMYIELIVDYFGGIVDMAKELETTSLQLRNGPCCCCCFCCPHPKPTIRNIRRAELLVFQGAIVKPILFLIQGIIFADQQHVVGPIATVIMILQLISTFTAMYGFMIFAQLVAVPLKEYNMKSLMKLAQFVIIFYNLQGAILQMLGTHGVIKCTDLLPAEKNADVYHYYLLILETFFLSLASAHFLRPKTNATFNLHPYHINGDSA